MTYDSEKQKLYWQIADLEIELKKYKDIEDELGIDLITLFKALKQEILFVKTDLGIKKTLKQENGSLGFKCLEIENNELVFHCAILYPNDITHKEWFSGIYLKLKDYGKAWALTKGELE